MKNLTTTHSHYYSLIYHLPNVLSLQSDHRSISFLSIFVAVVRNRFTFLFTPIII